VEKIAGGVPGRYDLVEFKSKWFQAPCFGHESFAMGLTLTLYNKALTLPNQKEAIDVKVSATQRITFWDDFRLRGVQALVNVRRHWTRSLPIIRAPEAR